MHSVAEFPKLTGAHTARLRSSVSRSLAWCGAATDACVQEIEVLSTGIKGNPQLRALQDSSHGAQADIARRVEVTMEEGGLGFRSLSGDFKHFLASKAGTQRVTVLPGAEGLEMAVCAADATDQLEAVLKPGVVFRGAMNSVGVFISAKPNEEEVEALRQAHPDVERIVVGARSDDTATQPEAQQEERKKKKGKRGKKGQARGRGHKKAIKVDVVRNQAELLLLIVSDSDDRLVVNPVSLGRLKVRIKG